MTTPLSEASPTSLQDLFDKDPLSLTDSDIEQIVSSLRAARVKWESAPKGRAPKAEPKPLPTDLADLGL
jgi:hypothetical protein